MSASDNNPKRRAGELKVPLQFVPTVAEAYIALVLEGGAKKYGEFNWRKEAISISTYVGAIRRHIGAIADGQDIDPESGLPHWAHIAASCCIALDAKALGKLVDDRVLNGAAARVLADIAAKRAVADSFSKDMLKVYRESLAPSGPPPNVNRAPTPEEIEAYLDRLENERDEP